jgi:hypothetical protein
VFFAASNQKKPTAEVTTTMASADVTTVSPTIVNPISEVVNRSPLSVRNKVVAMTTQSSISSDPIKEVYGKDNNVDYVPLLNDAFVVLSSFLVSFCDVVFGFTGDVDVKIVVVSELPSLPQLSSFNIMFLAVEVNISVDLMSLISNGFLDIIY